MAIYDWTSEDAVFYNGIILGCSGFLSFCAYFIYAVYGKRFIRERLFITVGLCMLCSFYFLTYPWPFYHKKLDYQYQGFTAPALNYTGTKRNTSSASTTSFNGNNATTASVVFESNVTQEAVGCDIDFKWCEYTPWVPPEVYFTFYPLISLGFPTVNVALSTLYSKILGPRRQSTMQSLLIMAGSCARLIGPIFISTLFQLYGPRVGWGIIAAAVGTSIVASIVFRRKLVPLNINRSLQAGQSMVYGKGTLYKF